MKGQKVGKAGRPRRSDAQGMATRIWARWLLEHTGLTASEMAELAGASTGSKSAGDRRNMWYRWQSGAITPSVVSLKNLERQLEATGKLPIIPFLLPNTKDGKCPSLQDVLRFGPYGCWWVCGMVAPSPNVGSAAYYLLENIVCAGKGEEDRLNAMFFVSALCENLAGYSTILTYLGMMMESFVTNKHGCFTEVFDAKGSIAFLSPTTVQDSWWQFSVLLAVGFYGAYEIEWRVQSIIIGATAGTGLDEYEHLARNFPWIDSGVGVAGSIPSAIISGHFSLNLKDDKQMFLSSSGCRSIQFGAPSPEKYRIGHSLDDLDLDFGSS
ncbi:MAG: hypothetical protein ACYDDD_01420 [Acidithiobacillus ferrivorans]|nr:hypothetical protein [Acidithiobacillus ferrivorans]